MPYEFFKKNFVFRNTSKFTLISTGFNFFKIIPLFRWIYHAGAKPNVSDTIPYIKTPEEWRFQQQKKILTINLIIFIEAPSKRIRFICGIPSLFGTLYKYAKRLIKMLVTIAKHWNLRPICNIIMQQQSCSSVFYIV